jgi:hypothetical protein
MGNRQRIPGYGVTGPKLVFSVSAFPHANEKFSGVLRQNSKRPKKARHSHQVKVVDSVPAGL